MLVASLCILYSGVAKSCFERRPFCKDPFTNEETAEVAKLYLLTAPPQALKCSRRDDSIFLAEICIFLFIFHSLFLPKGNCNLSSVLCFSALNAFTPGACLTAKDKQALPEVWTERADGFSAWIKGMMATQYKMYTEMTLPALR